MSCDCNKCECENLRSENTALRAELAHVEACLTALVSADEQRRQLSRRYSRWIIEARGLLKGKP